MSTIVAMIAPMGPLTLIHLVSMVENASQDITTAAWESTLATMRTGLQRHSLLKARSQRVPPNPR